MILSSLNVVNYLQVKFPDILFYNGFIDRSQTKCAGLYIREGASPNIAIGGLDNTSYSTLPLTLLVHWTEDAEETQVKANDGTS
jgi:hypothetical protein